MQSTIFFGNGINRLTPENISWSDLLDRIKGKQKFDNGNLPNTLIYERIILDNPNKYEDVLYDEYEVKLEIAKLMSEIKPHKVYTELYNLNAHNYITTNYDYAFIKSLQKLDIVNLPVIDYSSEDIYSIRRSKLITNTNEIRKYFWQIHGEIGKPASIMLGLDHYCGEIGKIDNYIKGRYRYLEHKKSIKEISIENKLKKNKFNNSSWIELFFNSNIHIIGFSFDYAEIDLWWIINKRARMKKSEFGSLIKNEIIYYCYEINPNFEGILNSMDIKVEKTPIGKGDDKYNLYYKDLIKKLQLVL